MRMAGPPPAPKRGQNILSYMVNELLPWLKSNRVAAGDGLTESQTHNGKVLEGGAGTPPWKVTSSGTAVKVNIGTIGGIVPSNIFAELTIAGTGTEYVIVTATMTSNAPTSALLSIQTTAPTPSLTNESAPPAEVHDVLAVLLDGQIFQVRKWNLNVESQLVFEAPVTEPQIGEPNTTPWYRWAVIEGAA